MSTFQVGQKVKAVASVGWIITQGKHYTVVEVIPPLVLPNFTFPEYVVVLDDRNIRSSFHTHRFIPLED